VPVEVGATFGSGVRTALVVFAIMLLIGLVVGPPLTARLLTRRKP
jgi:hypothetical protein